MTAGTPLAGVVRRGRDALYARPRQVEPFQDTPRGVVLAAVVDHKGLRTPLGALLVGGSHIGGDKAGAHQEQGRTLRLAARRGAVEHLDLRSLLAQSPVEDHGLHDRHHPLPYRHQHVLAVGGAHLAHGVALLARELIVRTTPLKSGGWLFTACTSIAVAVSAFYELVEWWFAETFGGAQAVDFLGSQGDVWDAQKDMLMALLGALSSLTLLGPLQQRQIDRLTTPT